jgi:hypothetical protein
VLSSNDDPPLPAALVVEDIGAAFVVTDSADQKLALMLSRLLPVMLRNVEHDAFRVLELGLSRRGAASVCRHSL